MFNFLPHLPFIAQIIIMICFGLIVGSFLNVVITRTPLTLLSTHNANYNIIIPRSHCTHCRTALNYYDIIPILSFLILSGKCRFCKKRISWQYPCIEIIFTLLTLTMFFHFGFSIRCMMSLILTSILLALLMIDLKHYLLPDQLTLPLLWIGLLCNTHSFFTTPSSAIWGASLGYCSLWSLYKVHKFITKKEGLGYGDFKLTAAIGAWLGIFSLPIILMIASSLATVMGVTWLLIQKKDRHFPIPFGPFLAISSLIYLLYGQQITHGYLRLIMLN